MTPQVFVTESGEGDTTLVLLHSLALDHTIWDDVLPNLSGVRVLRCDLPGHGRSQQVVATTLEEMADAVAGSLADRGEGTVVVWGLSLGGNVAQALAARHPDRIAALGLSDTTAWYGPEAPTRWAERAAVAREKGMAALSEFQLARWFNPEFLRRNPNLGKRLLTVFAANDVEAYARTCAAMGAMDLRESSASIAVPTSILVGQLDPATPLPHAQDLHERIEGSTLEVLAGCSHLSPLEAPEIFAARVRELCDRLAVPS